MKGYLCLQDGKTFQGDASQNWEQPVQGEIVFFTGMTGYQEVLTDPSYKDQIVVFTYPLIGNYGINEVDGESQEIQVSGVVMFHCSESTSHYLATSSLKDYLNQHEVPFITGIDTREITKAIRAGGSHQAILSSQKENEILPSESGQMHKVEGQEIESYGTGDLHIVLIDFGWKKSILHALLGNNTKVTVIPFTKLNEFQAKNVHAVVLSNGPGDPTDAEPYLPQIKKLIDKHPTFGICMGHQVIALAYGAETEKLPFGHRGANHPVKDVETGKVFMSSQNHNYVVKSSSLEGTPLAMRFYNVNDGTVEGLTHKEHAILTAQFHPEAHPGPADAEWLFDDFFKMIQSKKEEGVYV
ncbi:carbamoyl phosphate synthase small subunit [Halobacillus litoralis]|uniref:carbamoyl phosphate synthase small subunit n=1 Tax=Halobacillus litoralis TaxID=45668 RepID=UPI001CD7FDE8|nr:carbamoyl phosphate synthase small subunit [Halobacillus litoralis]MCA0971233.1 carbamoyl phosphate synthase small subunit [Halobacillus litoralis]